MCIHFVKWASSWTMRTTTRSPQARKRPIPPAARMGRCCPVGTRGAGQGRYHDIVKHQRVLNNEGSDVRPECMHASAMRRVGRNTNALCAALPAPRTQLHALPSSHCMQIALLHEPCPSGLFSSAFLRIAAIGFPQIGTCPVGEALLHEIHDLGVRLHCDRHACHTKRPCRVHVYMLGATWAVLPCAARMPVMPRRTLEVGKVAHMRMHAGALSGYKQGRIPRCTFLQAY